MFNTDTFEPLTIFPSTEGGTVVIWTLRPDFNVSSPYTFTLQWAESDVGDWEDVNETPVIDGIMDIDTTKRNFNKTLEIAYRVKLVAGGNTYYSEPKIPYGNWNRHDFLIARDIVRKENLRMNKYTGDDGWLIKRMVFGEKCTACVANGTLDWDLDIPLADARTCTTCRGTGVVGGYFTPYSYRLTPTNEKRKRQLNDQLGQIQPMTKLGRVLAFPQAQRGDLWFSEDSDRRYFIHEVRHVAEMRGIPIVSNIEVRQAPLTDPIYTIEFEL